MATFHRIPATLRVLSAAGLVMLAGAMHGQTAAPAPAVKCTAPAYREFDFWIGEWDVHDPAGKRVGENRISRIHDGCALLEEWRGNGGVSGSSVNVYDRERGRWHQTWVDSGGGLLVLHGGFADGAMTLSGESLEAGPPVKRSLQRIRWQLQPDGRVRQLWEASTDDGRAWTIAFDGWYTKRK